MLRILIVEDDDITKFLYKQWIVDVLNSTESEMPIIINMASDGKEASQFLSQKDYSVTILDKYFPEGTIESIVEKYIDKMGHVVLCLPKVDALEDTSPLQGYDSIISVQKPSTSKAFKELILNALNQSYSKDGKELDDPHGIIKRETRTSQKYEAI